MIVVRMKRLHPRAEIPAQATRFSAGFDLRALDPCWLGWGHRELIRTGLAVELPPGFVMLVFARSGLAAWQGIRPANCVGVIDADYRGEILVPLTMDRCVDMAGMENPGYSIRAGERIAQAIIQRLPDVILDEAEELSPSERGEGGFGSTGL